MVAHAPGYPYNDMNDPRRLDPSHKSIQPFKLPHPLSFDWTKKTYTSGKPGKHPPSDAHLLSFFSQDMEVTVIDATEWAEVDSQLNTCLTGIRSKPDDKRALVIGGVALELAKDR